jgi:hypothetical protein
MVLGNSCTTTARAFGKPPSGQNQESHRWLRFPLGKPVTKKILPDYWQVTEYRRRSNRGSLAFCTKFLTATNLNPGALNFSPSFY